MKDKKTEKGKDKTEKLLNEQKKLAQEYLAGWQRARADYLNFKKEQEEKFKEFEHLAKLDLIIKLLPILDSLEEATKNISFQEKNNQWFRGMINIKKQIKETLEKEGLAEIETQEGERFDPMIHEAMEQVESALPEGHVAGLLQKGYKVSKKLLRPAKVKVSKGRGKKLNNFNN